VVDYVRQWIGASTPLPSRRWGELSAEVASFSPAADGDLVVAFGEPWGKSRPLVRIHSECVFGEVFDSALCDCKDQLLLAMQRMEQEGHGILFYLRFDGRGAGLGAKVKATELELEGVDTYESRRIIGVEPESRSFVAVGEFLKARGLQQVLLLTNNPGKADDLRAAGIRVRTEPLLVNNPNEHVASLYQTKAERFGHTIPKVLYEDG
jgi:GTP cyclohydrolase II